MTSFAPGTEYVEYLKTRDRNRAALICWFLCGLLTGPSLASILIAPLNNWVASGNPKHPVLAFWFNPLGWLWGKTSPTRTTTAPDADFEHAYTFSRTHEGECNHSSQDIDVGGFTCKGITQGFLNAFGKTAGVKATAVGDLSEQDAKKLYRYIWDNARCDRFQQPMDLLCFDSALNFGPRWTEFLDELVGEGIDPIGSEPTHAAKRFAELRMDYRDKRVSEDPTQKAFRDGWLNRDRALLNYITEFDARPRSRTGARAETMFPLVGQSITTAVMTSPYGDRSNPTGGGGREFHSGTDYAAAVGHPLVFPEASRVESVFASSEGGRCGAGVSLVPLSDSSLSMVFCHLVEGSNNHLKEGNEYKAGGLIGTVGTTGRVSGPHMHLGMKRDGEWIDPQPYIEQHFTKEGIQQ